MQQPETRYFATDPSGGIRELIPLERPIQSMNEVLNWTTGALTQAYTMSFANYREALQESRPHFTRGGWRSEEHTSELPSLMRISYAVFCLQNKHRSINITCSIRDSKKVK